jgi:hypothetical protein
MAADLQEVFNRIRETKQEQKELRKMYKDALEASDEYKELVEKLEVLKQKKKQIETQTKEDVGNNFKKLDALKMHVKTDLELLSDLAFNKLVAGERVEIQDNDHNRYEPVFMVRFKKA